MSAHIPVKRARSVVNSKSGQSGGDFPALFRVVSGAERVRPAHADCAQRAVITHKVSSVHLLQELNQPTSTRT
jgi:hypothetical protein